MADRLSFTLSGLDAALRKFEQKATSVKREMTNIVKPAAKIQEREQKRLARVRRSNDPQGARPPGRMPLQQGIKARKDKAKKSWVRYKVGPTPKVAHGFPLETGHKQSGRYRYARGVVKPYPFAEPAWQNKAAESESVLISGIKSAVKK